MDFFQSMILGIAQGASEFLPISSTAHLAIIPYIFHWKDPGLSFDVALHLGTLLALIIFFWRDWLEIIFSAFRMNSVGGKNNFKKKYNSKILWLIIIATIPGAIFGFIFENKAETVFRNPLLIAFTLSVIGLILYLSDKYLRHRKEINQVNWKDSILIGISQAVAIIPGVSRSGATISVGLMRGLNKESAARFSFLLSTPIILGAAVFKLPALFLEGLNMNIIVGIIFSALSGYLAIKYLLKFIEKWGYSVFFWYRLGLALAIVIFYFTR